MTFDHNEEQWRAAGQWAREILAEHPHRRIAIVAPDLGKYREVIEHGLKESLCPLALINPGDAANQPYHLSLGTNLASHPASGSGLKLLEFVFARSATIAQISEQIVSPYIVGAQNELGERSALAMRLPRLLPYESNLTRLLDEMDYQMQQKQMEPCPILYNTLQQSIQLMLELPAKDTAANWALHFTDMLEIFDWPGECNPGSDEFQAINAFRQRLNQLAELDLVLGKIRIDSALGWLRRRLSDQLFQVEAKQAQVQVLGILETTGLDFDHVWFGGLIEPDWPPGSRPNPFIPITLQREAGVETSSVDAARQYADLLQHGLFASAGDIVLSRHLYDGDVLLECSPLVMQCGALNAQTAKTTPSVVELLHDQKPEFESIDENKGPALDLDTPVAGGYWTDADAKPMPPWRLRAISTWCRATARTATGSGCGGAGFPGTSGTGTCLEQHQGLHIITCIVRSGSFRHSLSMLYRSKHSVQDQKWLRRPVFHQPDSLA